MYLHKIKLNKIELHAFFSLPGSDFFNFNTLLDN